MMINSRLAYLSWGVKATDKGRDTGGSFVLDHIHVNVHANPKQWDWTIQADTGRGSDMTK